jgi:hypothetical protein
LGDTMGSGYDRLDIISSRYFVSVAYNVRVEQKKTKNSQHSKIALTDALRIVIKKLCCVEKLRSAGLKNIDFIETRLQFFGLVLYLLHVG